VISAGGSSYDGRMDVGWLAIVACAGCGRIGFADRDASSLDTIDGAPQGYALAILADHPVGYWRLGEASGLIARDASGNGFDGAYQGGVTLGRPGALANDGDTAVSLDGTTGFVRIPNSPRLDSLTVASAEGWVRGGTSNGDQEIWSAWDGGATGYQLIYNNGTAGVWSGNGIVNAPTAITDTNWHHVAGVWDTTTGRLYVDGVLSATGAIQFTTTTLDNQIGTQCQGANSTTCNDYRTGDIDEVAVYDYALSAATIATHYHAGLGN
jgi:hypothetical protein